MSVDPLAADYVAWSPYNYVLGNPLKYVDPDGQSPTDPPVKIIVQNAKPQNLDVGHTFVTVGSGENTVAYTYGRYAELGKQKGPLNATNLTGEGVLIRLEGQDALDLVDKYKGDYSADVYEITNADGDAVAGYFEGLFNGSDQLPSMGKYKDDERARVIDNYELFSNNCTTLSVCGVEAGLEDCDLKYVDDVNHPKFKGTVTKHVNSVTPTGLNNDLKEVSKKPENGVIKE